MNRLSVIMANKKSEALKGSGSLSESEKRKKGSVWMLQSGHFFCSFSVCIFALFYSVIPRHTLCVPNMVKWRKCGTIINNIY